MLCLDFTLYHLYPHPQHTGRVTPQLNKHYFTAVSHYGTSVGHQEKIANVQTYVSEPTNPSVSKGVILCFSAPGEDVTWYCGVTHIWV
ncbi:hypothetical protein P692DRAFT_201791712, partial [Suillus brevipes Sb2]